MASTALILQLGTEMSAMQVPISSMALASLVA
jgi:hypothetical protein